MLLDDLALQEIDYFVDFEEDTGGWQADGWVRIQNVLPQTYQLALITFGKTITVKYIPIAAENVVDIPLHLGSEVKDSVLVVTGTTRYTRQKAAYQVGIVP
jgi:hypothetical protein